MASDLNYVEYICDQAGLAGRLSFRKMFGEYALYLDGKVVAFVCDNQLYLKPTEAGRALLARVDARPFFPRGKPYFRLAEEIDDRALLQRLLSTTALALPMPKASLPRRGPGKR